MREGYQVADEDDGLHALERDYTIREKTKPRRLRFSKVPAINFGVICLLLGGLTLLIGVVLSQWNPMSQATTARVFVAHRVGMWFVLGGGVCVFIGIRARSEVYVQRRKRRKKTLGTLRLRLEAENGRKPITLDSWRMAINEFGFLVPSALTADVLRPEVGEVYLVVHHVVLAIFRWDQDQEGVVHMVMRQTDRGRVLKQCVKLLAFLDAKLIQEVEVDVVGRV